MRPDRLNEQFGVDGVVEFGAGPGGLTRASITSPGGTATVLLHGAHVTAYQPAGGVPVLWMSGRSWFEPGRPVRGGVPVCFPWFGSTGPAGDSPHHGFARLTEWEVESTGLDGDLAEITLVLFSDDDTRRYWPGQFELRHTVTVGAELSMSLEVSNTGDEAFTITEALHTYLAVSDVRKVSIAGLEGAEYVDTVGEERRLRQGDEPIRFAGEVDRAYVNTDAACVLDDPGMGRRIRVAKSGSLSTVVWNPWTAKAARMPDYADDEWPGMVCIETANVYENAVTVAPGGAHIMEARIRHD